jgi:hypothetical protein
MMPLRAEYCFVGPEVDCREALEDAMVPTSLSVTGRSKGLQDVFEGSVARCSWLRNL